MNNKFAKNSIITFAKSSSFFGPICKTFSYNFFPDPTSVLVFTPNNQVDKYADKNLQKATKLILNTLIWGQGHGQAQIITTPNLDQFELCEQSFIV